MTRTFKIKNGATVSGHVIAEDDETVTFHNHDRSGTFGAAARVVVPKADVLESRGCNLGVVAQGGGFYGCSLFTVPEDLEWALIKALSPDPSDLSILFDFDGSFELTTVPFECSDPATVLDTGSGPEELRALRALHAMVFPSTP